MKKIKFYLFISGILSVIPVVILFGMYFFRLKKNSYNFTRQRIDVVTGIIAGNVKYSTHYLAGYSNDQLYFGNPATPAIVYKMNSGLKAFQKIKIEISESDYSTAGTYRLYVEDSYFYLFNGIGRSILRGKTGEWKAKPYAIYIPYFQISLPVSDHSLVYRYINSKTQSNSLRKESLAAARIENPGILEKQVDGIFCTQGFLEFNSQSNQLIYLYLYRNQILIIDTNLNLIKKIKTIDPVDRADFVTSTIKSNNSTVLTSPSLEVNAGLSCWKDYIFVHAKLMGKHEDDVLFKNSVAIDVYSIKKSRYLYSFYLPKQDNLPVKQIKVINNYIFTTYGKFVARYSIKLPDS